MHTSLQYNLSLFRAHLPPIQPVTIPCTPPSNTINLSLFRALLPPIQPVTIARTPPSNTTCHHSPHTSLQYHLSLFRALLPPIQPVTIPHTPPSNTTCHHSLHSSLQYNPSLSAPCQCQHCRKSESILRERERERERERDRVREIERERARGRVRHRERERERERRRERESTCTPVGVLLYVSQVAYGRKNLISSCSCKGVVACSRRIFLKHQMPIITFFCGLRTVLHALCSSLLWLLQGGVENVQYATNQKRKGGGSAHAIGSPRSASMMAPW